MGSDSVGPTATLGLLIMGLGAVGCQTPNPVPRYPEGTLHVRYESAETHSSCLVASTAMAANYLLGKRHFNESRIVGELKLAGRDATSLADMKAYLGETPEALRAVTLSGRLHHEPPEGLGYWINKRGYPVICIINRDAEDPGFNHAVLVIGFSQNKLEASADIIHYLDPSSVEPLHSADVTSFEQLWARCDHAMMIVVSAPK